MANPTRRPAPGDSAPDFSHLQEHDEDDGEAPRLQADSENVDESALTPDTAANAGDDQSHVFFDVDDRLSDDPAALAGETAAMPSRDDRQAESTKAGEEPPETDPADVLASSPTDKSGAGLTDVGLPSFDQRTSVEAAAARAAAAAAADSGPEPQEPIDQQTASDTPSFPSADDLHSDADMPAFPSPSDVLSDDEVPSLPTPSDFHKTSEKEDPSAEGRGREIPDAATEAAWPPSKPSTTQDRPSGANAVRTATAAASTSTPAATSHPAGKQRLLVILLASYASAATISLIWLWTSRNAARPHDLESLPDVAPLNENEFRYPSLSATMPPGHTLALGSAQRLGHIKIEPLRVSKGPVEFVHFSDAAAAKPPTAPVLKLWLRFTNVSDDQLIAPLDPKLLFTRDHDDFGEPVIANQLVFPAEAKHSGGRTIFMLDHPHTSEWDLKGQQLGHRLKPRESIETYIPTQPADIASLSGDLLWRVHFRKGYNPESGHGVTTMIEVPFRASDIQGET